jgi:predicted nucleic acid-binding protein
MESIVLDTDVASLMQKRRLPDPMRRALERYEWCVTSVTLGELAKWGELHNWGIRRWTQLADWVGGVTILNADGDVTYRWGQLAAAAQRRGRQRPANDMWIAACCLAADLPLATFNTKDFADFAEHHGLTLVQS